MYLAMCKIINNVADKISQTVFTQDYSDWNKKKRNNQMYLSIFMSSPTAWLLPGEVKSD